MKRFNEGITKYINAVMTEIRGGITKTPLHILKTIVIMFIPFLYAFTYLWAFYDPVDKAENLNLTIVTSRDDAMGEFVKAKAINKGIKIHNGPNVEMTANFNQIYSDNVEGDINADNQLVKDSLLTVDVPDLDHVLVATLRNAIISWKSADSQNAANPDSLGKYVESLGKTMGTFLAANTINGKASMNYNYKKNFLIGFATDISSAQSGGINEVLNMVFNALAVNDGDNIIANMVVGDVTPDGEVSGQWLNDKGKTVQRTFGHHQWAAAGADPLLPDVTKQQFAEFMSAMQLHFDVIKAVVGPKGGHTINGANAPNDFTDAIAIITQHSQLGTDGKQAFGIGLSPFFISIGMWFGAVAMTVLVHRKIYDKKTFVKWRYMAKGTIINTGIIIQASILMFSLKLIGLGSIGYAQWALMYGSALFIGIVFATFIMAVRLSIPSRALSIYIIVIFMVLNIVCSGGIFPIQTQNVFVRAMNTFLPMHFSVEILRQGLVATDWSIWGECMGYLSIYLLFVPIGVIANYIYTHRWYIRYNYDMPVRMQKYHEIWLQHNPERKVKIVARLRKAGHYDKKGGM